MKTLIALVMLGLAAPSAPDEGQWLPEQFMAMDWSELKARGLQLTKDEFWHPEKGGVLSAAVQINGCSASFVSADGLVVTNHHCGFGAIQRLSTVDNNLVENGFVAERREQELHAPGMVVYVVKRIEDVTERIQAEMAKASSDVERFWAERDAIARIVSEAESREPNVRCSVSSYFNGRKYSLFTRTMLRDVRLVYAPPRAIGEFGGDVDNWEWPRHTGDFTFFRAYVSPEGRPAGYSEQNVPYRPDHFLKVSAQGITEGDLVMILGYPGRTERYLSSTAVTSRENNLFPLRHRLLTEIIAVMDRATEGDPAAQLAMSSQRKRLANVQKNALGMIKGLDRNGVVARKLAEEKAFAAWVNEQGSRRRAYGQVLPELLEIDALEARFEAHDEILSNLLRNAPFLSQVMQLCYAAEEKAKAEDQRERGYKQRDLRRLERGFTSSGLGADVDRLERPIMALVADEAKRLADDAQLANFKEVMGDMDGATWAEMAYGSTAMKDSEARKALYEGGPEAIEKSDDPLVRLGRALAEDLRQTRMRRRNMDGRRLVLGNQWIEAQQKWRGASFYPDANSSLRISVASVKGYAPRDGVFHVPQTSLAGVLAKETGEDPFANPEALMAAAKNSSKSRFMDRALGDVPVCFLTDGDTTGGNSGSPVVNGKGELVGLNFDRVFENVAGDYGWNADRSRNISVDMRYVLWNLEQVMPAPHLIEEMGL